MPVSLVGAPYDDTREGAEVAAGAVLEMAVLALDGDRLSRRVISRSSGAGCPPSNCGRTLSRQSQERLVGSYPAGMSRGVNWSTLL